MSLEEYIMKQVNCPICNRKCIKHGKIKSGSQRWFCKSCKLAFTPKIDNDTKQLQQFLNWLFSKEVQSNMSGSGRTFRRKTSKFWDIWVMSPKIEESKDVLYLDGIYLWHSKLSCGCGWTLNYRVGDFHPLFLCVWVDSKLSCG